MEYSLTVVDGCVLVFTVLSAILAMARGITREVLGIASFMAASFIATYQVELFTPLLTSSVDLHPLATKFSADVDVVASWITGFVLFIILWIIFTIITVKISRYINDTIVSGIDRFLGFIFGLLRGLFMIGIVYTMYTHFYPPEKYHDAVAKAQTKPVLDITRKYIGILAKDLLPEKIAEGFSQRPEANYQSNNTQTQGQNPDILENIIRLSAITGNNKAEKIFNQLQKNGVSPQDIKTALATGTIPPHVTPEQILNALEQNGVSTDKIKDDINARKLPNNLTPEQILQYMQ
jgi:membrane protein required for colicin V production